MWCFCRNSRGRHSKPSKPPRGGSALPASRGGAATRPVWAGHSVALPVVRCAEGGACRYASNPAAAGHADMGRWYPGSSQCDSPHATSQCTLRATPGPSPGRRGTALVAIGWAGFDGGGFQHHALGKRHVCHGFAAKACQRFGGELAQRFRLVVGFTARPCFGIERVAACGLWPRARLGVGPSAGGRPVGGAIAPLEVVP